MQITMNTYEIKEAITDWINTQGFNTEDMNLDIHITTSRKPAGFSASVRLGKENDSTQVEEELDFEEAITDFSTAESTDKAAVAYSA